MVFDVLSRLITNAHNNDSFKGIKVAYVPALTHLLFVDDAILFSRDSPEDVYHIISLPSIFTEASGQKINISKSGLICGSKMATVLRNRLPSITSIPIWNSQELSGNSS